MTPVRTGTSLTRAYSRCAMHRKRTAATWEPVKCGWVSLPGIRGQVGCAYEAAHAGPRRGAILSSGAGGRPVALAGMGRVPGRDPRLRQLRGGRAGGVEQAPGPARDDRPRASARAWKRRVAGRVLFAAKVTAARATARLSRLAGAGGGTTLPGRVLLALAPDGITRLASGLESGAVVISATNGKTTTAAMLAAILDPPLRVCHNRAGANLASGVASALVAAGDAAVGVFEVDEAALPSVAAQLDPSVLVLGNLFRDQLDRYGELELVGERWSRLAGD